MEEKYSLTAAPLSRVLSFVTAGSLTSETTAFPADVGNFISGCLGLGGGAEVATGGDEFVRGGAGVSVDSTVVTSGLEAGEIFGTSIGGLKRLKC